MTTQEEAQEERVMTEAEKIRWSTAYNAIQQQVIKSIRGESKVIYSAYKTQDSIPIDNLSEIPIEGMVAIVDSRKYKGGDRIYITSVLVSPPWLELAREADHAIKRTGDNHHVFLEGYEIVGSFDNITLIRFKMGS